MAIGTGAAILGGSLVSGFLGNRSSGRAADASNAATQASIDEQRRQFNALMDRSAPYNEAGVSALNSLLAMEGLPLVSMGQSPAQKPAGAGAGGSPGAMPGQVGSQDYRDLGQYYGPGSSYGGSIGMDSPINFTDPNGMTVYLNSMMPSSMLANQMNSRAPVLQNRSPSVAVLAPPPRMR